MGFHNMAAEEVNFRLVILKKHPVLRAGTALDAHCTIPEVRTRFLEGSMRIRK